MSSSHVAISVRGVSKAYTISHETRQSTLAETVLHRMRNPLHRPTRETFWALKDVSFDVKRGDVVGIIGRNGAGKSTLLKILSRITEPTCGEAQLHGRVGSLLEVGTGFHPELTGRENIFLNGAILGMKRAEIKKQFDAIVDFAGVEQFLDTPVKRYSSGMYVRLAFAVAAHLEAEIMVVDEVLSVGDAEFQQKCLGKMNDVAHQGRTVLFVSHNMSAIQSLCTLGLVLHCGTLGHVGDLATAVAEYLSDNSAGMDGEVDLAEHPSRSRGGPRWLRKLTLLGESGGPTARFPASGALRAVISIHPVRTLSDPRVAIAIEDRYGRRIGTTASFFGIANAGKFDKPFDASVRLPRLGLGAGRYLLSVSVAESGSGLLDAVENAMTFDVDWDNSYPTGERYEPVFGPVILDGDWSFAPSPS
jgi:lipopolysaccharide transport system ATP-binding protein